MRAIIMVAYFFMLGDDGGGQLAGVVANAEGFLVTLPNCCKVVAPRVLYQNGVNEAVILKPPTQYPRMKIDFGRPNR